MEQKVLSVTQLNNYLKGKFETDPLLAGLCVCGEISNYKLYPSGHHYFTLKDAESAVRCVMFKGNAFSLRFRPENGMSVICIGRVSVYPRDGAYQLYCSQMTPFGVGDLAAAYEQLKAKLAAEGLFDPAHKKPIPAYPHRIAIITSSAGAAVHDMLRIISKRYPLSKVMLLPVRVQGVEAPPEIAEAIRYANEQKLADVIITGRGGGSLEDLWAFNDERVARAIYASDIPVISAVGHEPDVTISDFVADLRAATPSNAAELVTPDQAELRTALSDSNATMVSLLQGKMKAERRDLERLANASVFRNPQNMVQDKRLRLDMLSQRLYAKTENVLAANRKTLVQLAAGLDAMSPLRVLGRGYSILSAQDGVTVTSVTDLKSGDRIRVKLKDGSADAQILSVQKEEPV